MQDLYEVFKGLLFWKLFLGFEGCHKIALIAVLKDKIDVIGCLFQVDKPDDVVIFAAAKDLYFVVK
jgi:hypothetical protein